MASFIWQLPMAPQSKHIQDRLELHMFQCSTPAARGAACAAFQTQHLPLVETPCKQQRQLLLQLML
jgi:hypothetical protein